MPSSGLHTCTHTHHTSHINYSFLVFHDPPLCQRIGVKTFLKALTYQGFFFSFGMHLEVVGRFFLNKEGDGKVIGAIASLFSIALVNGVLCKMLSSLAPALPRR